MTGNKSLFQNYQADTSNLSVRIANGSYSKVVGTSSVRVTQNLYLNSVLHVPDLDCILLSISKLTRDLACVVKFYPNSCVFQDLELAKIIGSVDLCFGLYLLNYDLGSLLAFADKSFY